MKFSQKIEDKFIEMVNPVSFGFYPSIATAGGKSAEAAAGDPFAQIDAALTNGDEDQAIQICESVIRDQPDSVKAFWAIFIREALDSEFQSQPLITGIGGYTFKTFNAVNSERSFTLVYRNGVIKTVIPGGIEFHGNKLTVHYIGRFDVVFKHYDQNIEENNVILEAMQKIPTDFFSQIAVFEFRDMDHPPKKFGKTYAGLYESTDQTVTLQYNISFATFAHEMIHHWDDWLTPQGQNDESRTYYRISWRGQGFNRRREDDVRDFRGGIFFDCTALYCLDGPSDFNIHHDAHPYGMENPHEDIASFGEDYVVKGVDLRQYVRNQMMVGNFEPAVKYLFIKHVMPFNGQEYGVNEASQALTIEEVRNKIDEWLAGHLEGFVPESTLEALDNIESLSAPEHFLDTLQAIAATPPPEPAVEVAEEPAAEVPVSPADPRDEIFQLIEEGQYHEAYDLIEAGINGLLAISNGALTLEEIRLLISLDVIMGDLCSDLGDWDSAPHYYSQALYYGNLPAAADDPEIRDILRDARFGLARVHFSEEEYEKALEQLQVILDEVGEDVQAEELEDAIRVYLERGEIYLARLNSEEAFRNFNEGRRLYENIDPHYAMEFSELFAAIQMGYGNTYFLEEEYAIATDEFAYALTVVGDVENASYEKLLIAAGAHLGSARAYSRQRTKEEGVIDSAADNIERALAEIEEAKGVLEVIRTRFPGLITYRADFMEIEDRVKEAETELWLVRNGYASLMFLPYFSYLWGPSLGENYSWHRSQQGPLFGGILTVEFGNVGNNCDLQIGFFGDKVERKLYDYDPARWESFLRLDTDFAFGFLFGLTYTNEEPRFDLRLNPTFSTRIVDMVIGQRTVCNRYGCDINTLEFMKGSQAAFTPTMDASFYFKLFPGDSTIFLGVDAGASFLFSDGSMQRDGDEIEGSPGFLVERVRLEEEIAGGDPDAADELESLSDQNDFLYSWYARPTLKWQLPPWEAAGAYQPTIRLGLNIEDDHISLSDYGFWYLDGFSTFKISGVVGFNATFSAAREHRLQFPFSVTADLGNYFHVRGSFGIGWNFDPLLLQLMAGGSYFSKKDGEREISWETADLSLQLIF